MAITGATSASYTPPTTTAGTSFYYVYITNASGGFLKSQIATVTVTQGLTDEIVVGGSSGVQFSVLKDLINYLLGTDKNKDYTVRFAEDLSYPLFISPDTFPGAGRVTIKSDVRLTKGIHITRSNVELKDLKIMITEPNNAPKFEDKNPSAVMVSGRYWEYPLGNSGNKVDAKSWVPTLADYKELNDNNKTINNVAIDGCDITFIGSADNQVILGICVDPYTVGKTGARRVNIQNCDVDVDNKGTEKKAFCFLGNNAVLSGNTFTSTYRAVQIAFVFELTYGGSSDSISFTGNASNKFITSDATNNIFAMFYASVETATGKWDPSKYEEVYSSSSKSFEFTDLKPQYKKMIEDLFGQAPSTTGKIVRFVDIAKSPDDAIDYIKDGSTYKLK
jgi:hypothetical protein